MSAICLHGFVSGQVQGVFFRRHTYEQAIRLNVKGWVKNLSDGRVEVLICGETEAVQLMRDWLKHGPPRAAVTDLQIEEYPYDDYSGFEIR